MRPARLVVYAPWTERTWSFVRFAVATQLAFAMGLALAYDGGSLFALLFGIGGAVGAGAGLRKIDFSAALVAGAAPAIVASGLADLFLPGYGSPAEWARGLLRALGWIDAPAVAAVAIAQTGFVSLLWLLVAGGAALGVRWE